MAFGVTCKMFSTSDLRSTRIWVTSVNRCSCSAVASPAPPTKRSMSPTATDKSVSAAPRLERWSLSTPVSTAKRSWNSTICTLLSRRASTKVCRPLMISAMSPPPSARTRPKADSSAKVWRNLAPLPCMAFAVLSMKRARGVSSPLVAGPRSVANRINWAFTSSHSSGTAVLCSGISAPSGIVDPVVP